MAESGFPSRRSRRRSAGSPSRSPSRNPATPGRVKRGNPAPSNVIRTDAWRRDRSQGGDRPTPKALPAASTPSDPKPQRGRNPAPSRPVSPRLDSSRPPQGDHAKIRLGPDRRRPQLATHAPAFRANPGKGSARSTPSPLMPIAPAPPPRRPHELPAAPPRPQTASGGTAIQPLKSSSGAAARRSPTSNRRSKKPTSPLIYAIRLIILGVGIGSIAGTMLSAFDPAHQEATIAAQSMANGGEDGLDPSATLNALGNASGAERSLLSALSTGQEMRPLMAELQEMAAEFPQLSPGVFVFDLDHNTYVDLNGSLSFSAASTIKVPILVAFLQDVEANKIALNETLTMTEADVAGGSGEMQYMEVGTTFSAVETATLMIIVSDNTATNMLIRRMGGIEALNRRFQSWGLRQTTLRDLLPDLEGTNTTSPKELTDLMTRISQGDLLSMRSRDRMFDIMRRTRTKTLLPQGLGNDATIAHKTGDIGSMVGDVGIVDTPSGKRYAVTIMMKREHNDYRAQELIRRMSAAVYNYLEFPPSPEELQEFEASQPESDPGAMEMELYNTTD
ncbi:MAG: serine hydrolase [Synechococcales bacterium]|nr:serine hydrolase [Synechococcales bacterium]